MAKSVFEILGQAEYAWSSLERLENNIRQFSDHAEINDDHLTIYSSALKWDSVIEQKTVELGRFLIGRSSNLDLTQPSPSLSRVDDRDLRRRILSLAQSEARGLGIGRSTLHYSRKNAARNNSLLIYEKVRKRLRSESAPHRRGARS